MSGSEQLRLGKRYKLIFQDNSSVMAKHGIIKSYDNLFITLENVSGVTEIIPLNRVLRLECEE